MHVAELGAVGVVREVVQQARALFGGHVLEPAGELPVQEQRRAPRLRVRSQRRMHRVLLRPSVGTRIVNRPQVGEQALHAVREGVEGEVLIGEGGLPAPARQLLRGKNGNRRRGRVKRCIRMPATGL